MAATFEKLYKQLNKEQRAAVDAVYGPVMVIAGPGTGKTTVLSLRIANILRETDTPASTILALTFTEAGVYAMRKKLLEIIGPRAYEIRIHTFHSFSNDLIKMYPEEFSRIVGSEHMEDLEQIRIIESLIEKYSSENLRPKNNPNYYVLPVINAIRHLKRENISPEKFTKIKTEHSRTKELIKIYRAYEKELRARRLYDFEDMVSEAARVLEKNKDFKFRLQEEYQFVLADEHQDANQSQNRLLELLCDYDDSPNLFIVGDAKQAIFRFQGASLENFLYFEKKFPKARLISLIHNYRSQPKILDAAHSLMENTELPKRFREKLIASRATPSDVRQKLGVVETQDEQLELSHISVEVENLLKQNFKPCEIAIITRENREAERVEEELRRRCISVARKGDADILESVRIDALRRLFAAVVEPNKDELLAPVLFFDFLKLTLTNVFEIIHTPLRRVADEATIFRRLEKGKKEFSDFYKKILRWSSVAKNEPLVVAFEIIADESGFLESILARNDAYELLRLYEAFLESARRLAERDKRARLGDFLERIERAEAHGISMVSQTEGENGVQVMTAHKAKGLEFDYVFIVFAQEKKWGGKRGRSLFELPFEMKNEDLDERRLFYVALTRARKSVHISWHAKGENGQELLPSRFIFELDENTREHVNLQNSLSGHVGTNIASATARALGIFQQKNIRVSGGVSAQRVLLKKEYLNSFFLQQGFAATHLNNFLECPLKYFFLNLIRLPRAQSNAELYGSAIHAALATHFNAYAREADKPFSETAIIFENALRRTHLSESDFKKYLAEGKCELKGYLFSRKFARAAWNEYRVGGVFLPVSGEKLELTGFLDKVELLWEGGVRVVDYKTGQPKTRNEILGKTKNSDGNYYRQLVFYKLLLDGIKKSDRRMKIGAIDFIKQEKNGKYKSEEFEISSAEVSELKTLISDVASRILDLSFLKDGCNKKDCEWCRLAQSANLTR